MYGGLSSIARPVHRRSLIVEYKADGSATLFVPELNEHYHSVKGALTESSHIFIDMGLKASASPAPHILEIGFSTVSHGSG